MALNLKDKVVIVTGGSSGIGASTAIAFAKEGANVVITGRNEANLNKIAEECGKAGKKAFAIKADMTNDRDTEGVISKTVAKFGKLDVLVNNAGIYRVIPVSDKDYLKNFDDVMATNMRAVAVLTYYAVPHLAKTKGNIVNISSVAGSSPRPNHSMYGTSKAALNHYSKSMASELAPQGIRVNIVSPGPVQTPIFETSGSGVVGQQLAAFTALNKISEPEEVGELVVFLASEKAKSVTGAEYVIDCGFLVKSTF